MNIEKVRAAIIKILLATLVATSLVAVGVILMGSVTDLFGRIIWTLVAGVFYLGVLLAVLSTIPNIGQGPKSRSSLFVVNSILALTCASYLTSILSIWTVITDDLPLRIHLAYIVLLAGTLYAKPLIDVENMYPKIRRYIQANYFFIALASGLTAFAIVAPTEWDLWSSFYGRVIAASIVICVTLSMVITVLYHLYLQQHPELRQGSQNTDSPDQLTPNSHKPVNIWRVIGAVFLIIIGLPILLSIFGVVVRLFFL